MNIKKILNTAYAILGAATLFSGAIILVMLIIGMIIGGQNGAAVMLSAKKFSIWAYRMGAASIFIGFVLMFVTGYRNAAMSLKKDRD